MIGSGCAGFDNGRVVEVSARALAEEGCGIASECATGFVSVGAIERVERDYNSPHQSHGMLAVKIPAINWYDSNGFFK